MTGALPLNKSNKVLLCLAWVGVFLSLVLSEAWILKLLPVLHLFSGGLFLALNESQSRDTSGHVRVNHLQVWEREGAGSALLPAGESSWPPLSGTASPSL